MALKPSVCIDAVFEGIPEVVAIEKVAELGIGAIEFWMWWEKDLDAIQEICRRKQIEIAACCTKFISLVDEQVRPAYLEWLSASLETAMRIGCKTLISQVGDYLPGIPREKQHASLVEGLKQAARLLEGTSVTLAIEPLNELVDHRGYYLIRSDEAFQVVDEVGSEHVKLTFDIYHQQISEGNLISNITTHIDQIAHFHAAGNPGRNELDHGEIHYPSVFESIAATSYDRYVGLEYWPKDDPEVGLGEALKLFA